MITEENHNNPKIIVSLILEAHSNAKEMNQQSLYNLLNMEKNEIELTSNLLEILQNFKNYTTTLSDVECLEIIIYIKNFFQKVKGKPKLKNIKNIEQKIANVINIYLNNSLINDKINKFFNEIIASIFEFILILNDPKKFLQNFYDELIIKYTNINNNFVYEEMLKFIFIYENFCKIYLVYAQKYTEMNIIFEKYIIILNICKNITNKNNNSNLINQCILSFSKTAITALDSFYKSQIFFVDFNGSKNNSENNDIKDIFIENNFFLNFFEQCLNIYNGNNFTMCIENSDDNNNFYFQLCKSKGILIEVLTVFVKKLSKLDIFRSLPNFNKLIITYNEIFINYIQNFYINQSKNYPREKAENSDNEIIQLSLIVKIITFIDEIIGNKNIITNNNNIKYENIFKYIIVPNILPTELEKTFFEFDSEEYIKNLMDMCHLCEVKLPKQISLKLLMTMCDSIPSFFEYIVHLYIIILKNVIFVPNNIIDNKYINVIEFLTKNVSIYNLIEQCLQVLTSISYLFGDRLEVADFFCEEIDLINHKLVKINDEYLQSKLCMFYSYNLEILFHDDNEVLSKSFDDSLKFLFDCIQKEKKEALIKTSMNAINGIIFNNYMKKFCITQVGINSMKIINFFNDKKNLAGVEEEFNEFLKGIVKEYMYDLSDSALQLFELFWNKFLTLLKNINIENSNINNNNVLRDKTKEVNNAIELSTQINIITNFVNMIINKNCDIKNIIYEKILKIFPELTSFINSDFENEILELIIKVITDVKLLPNHYLEIFTNYLNFISDNKYKMESYHIEFIFSCLQCFKINILNNNIKDLLINILDNKFKFIRKKTLVKYIFHEHYIYCDLGLCINIFFFNNLNENIFRLLKIFYDRMERIPNTDYDLNVKLIINIILLLIKSENYDIFDEIFIHKKIINLNDFLIKFIQFFPIKDLTITQHQIISIFCAQIIRYLIMKKKLKQIILYQEENNFKEISDSDYQKIIYYIININITELSHIKQISIDLINKYNEKENNTEKNNGSEIKEFAIESYNNNKIIYKERESHIDKIKDEKISTYDFSDDNDSENDENKFNDDNLDDEEFITVKNESKNNFNNLYNKFANEEIKVYLKQINEFNMFELMMKDIEINDKIFYEQILNKIKSMEGDDKVALIEKFKGIQKIAFKNYKTFAYRRIVKINKN